MKFYNGLDEKCVFINIEHSEFVPVSAEELFEIRKLSDCKFLFISSPMEFYPNEILQSLDKKIKDLRQLSNNKLQIILILGAHYQYNSHLYRFINPNKIYYIDFFAFELYALTFLKKWQSLYNEYTVDQFENDFLMMMNKPNKIQRVGLVYKMWQKNLLKKGLYSFTLKNNEEYDFSYDLVRQELAPNLSRKEFRIFYKNVKAEIDPTRQYCSRKTNELSNFYCGLPFDPNTFGKSKFQIVTETLYLSDHLDFITEKTYWAILNSRPFIFLGGRNSFRILRSNGINMFLEYYKYIPKTTIPIEENLELATENIKHWIDNIDNWVPQLKLITEQNKQRLISLGKQQEMSLRKILRSFNIKSKPEDFFCNGYFLNHIWNPDRIDPTKPVKFIFNMTTDPLLPLV